MNKNKFVVSVVGGVLAAFVWYMVIALLFSAGADSTSNLGFLFWILVVIVSYLLYKRTTRAKHAAGWACVLLSTGSFAIPLSVFIWSARYTAGVASEGGTAAAIGAGLGGAMVLGIGVVLGLFLGLIFAVAAYFLLKK